MSMSWGEMTPEERMRARGRGLVREADFLMRVGGFLLGAFGFFVIAAISWTLLAGFLPHIVATAITTAGMTWLIVATIRQERAKGHAHNWEKHTVWVPSGVETPPYYSNTFLRCACCGEKQQT